MNRNHETRLRRLERRIDTSTDTFIIFTWSQTENGTVYQTLNDGRHYSPEAFDRLIDERSDTVFVTLQRDALAEAASAAYWDELEANKPTLQELFAENEMVARIQRKVAADYTGDDADDEVSRRIASELGTGDGGTRGADAQDADAQDADAQGAEEQDPRAEDEEVESWVDDVTLGSDRATLARYYEWLMRKTEPFFKEMMARKARLGER